MENKRLPIGWCLECGASIFRDGIKLEGVVTPDEINEFRRRLREKIPFMEGMADKQFINSEYAQGTIKMMQFVDLMLGKMIGEQGNEQEEKEEKE